VAKVASGAAETVPYFMVTNLARTLKELKERGIWIIGTSGDADKHLYQMDLTGPTALVLGAEGDGMRQLTRKTCDALVSIPMQGAVESLNVSVASGVCLYEALRRRGDQGLSRLVQPLKAKARRDCESSGAFFCVRPNRSQTAGRSAGVVKSGCSMRCTVRASSPISMGLLSTT